MDAASEAFRARVLADCGASPPVLAELLAYNQNPFAAAAPAARAFPLSDEAHIESWEEYLADARREGAFAALKRRFVQLQFPIRAGISGEEPYRNATRKGHFQEAARFAPGLELERPADLQLAICPTMAGRIPVVVAGCREDFVALVRAFAERNEPAPVPESMGACIVKGFNNWDRVAAYRRRWERAQVGPTDEQAWAEEFQRLIPQKELYQDRFLILSRGPYSAVSAAAAGAGERAWLERSLVIRREHEFTHYFTYRVFGAMRNNLLDELVADWVGLVRAYGRYPAELALRFLGLEYYPRYRSGGRLENYRGQPPISDDALGVLGSLAVRAARQIERFSIEHAALLGDLSGLARLTLALLGLTLEELASSEMKRRAEARLSRC
jgi:hypothetical protein